MSEENKNHYRKVFKSDHLGVADLEDFLEEGKQLIFTVTHVKQEMGVVVAGHKGNFNIAYFKEDIKPLVLNATNSKVMKKFNSGSPFVEDWDNTLIELYIDPTVKMKGDVVGGVRINPTQPKITKPELTEENKTVWDRAVKALKDGKTLDIITKHYTVSEENRAKLLAETKL